MDSAAVWAAMQHDKKKRAVELRIVWSPEPGAPEIVLGIDEETFTTAWIADAAH
jgi:3-dehydroquinate synthetase